MSCTWPPPHKKKKAWAQVYFLESLSVNVKVFPFESKCEHQHLLLSVFLSNSFIAQVAPCRQPLGVHPVLLLLLLLLPSLHPLLLSSLWSMFHKGTWKGLRWPGNAKEAPKLQRWTSQRVQGKGPDLATCHPTGQRGTVPQVSVTSSFPVYIFAWKVFRHLAYFCTARIITFGVICQNMGLTKLWLSQSLPAITKQNTINVWLYTSSSSCPSKLYCRMPLMWLQCQTMPWEVPVICQHHFYWKQRIISLLVCIRIPIKTHAAEFQISPSLFNFTWIPVAQ